MRDRSLEGHTVRRFDSELSQLHRQVLEMGALVLQQLTESLEALRDLDIERARAISRGDRIVDSLESEVDEKVVALAARRAPLGRDLRLVLVVSKCVTELEEAGDEAVNIAGKITNLCAFKDLQPNPELLDEIVKTAQQAVDMMGSALGAYDLLEEEPAIDVIRNHRSLEMMFQSEIRRLVEMEVHDSSIVSQLVAIALIAKSLDAIGRHAKKIAEHVIFYVRGEDVRHRKN
ncbi:MAG: phosphate signaling complex protein PhoU [Gammaproteobacteria bacterium]